MSFSNCTKDHKMFPAVQIQANVSVTVSATRGPNATGTITTTMSGSHSFEWDRQRGYRVLEGLDSLDDEEFTVVISCCDLSRAMGIGGPQDLALNVITVSCSCTGGTCTGYPKNYFADLSFALSVSSDPGTLVKGVYTGNEVKFGFSAFLVGHPSGAPCPTSSGLLSWVLDVSDGAPLTWETVIGTHTMEVENTFNSAPGASLFIQETATINVELIVS